MAGIQISYSKEIARELGKIAVYLPGETIDVGDIIQFPYGKKGIFGNRTAPLGSFKKITSLDKLEIDYDLPEFSNQPDTYHFMSNDLVETSIEAKVNSESENDIIPKIKGDLNLEFKSEGSIYFLAVDCDKKQLNDLASLEKAINTKGKNLPWQDTYLVTSVTVAKRALIIQSKSKNSAVSIVGDLETNHLNIIDANASIKIKKSKGDVFIKDWSEDVAVFMDLVKFERELFEIKNNRSITHSEPNSLVLKIVDVNKLIDKTNGKMDK